MGPREVTWRSWMVLGICVVVYAVLGWWLNANGPVLEWLYKLGLIAVTAGEVVFAVSYAVNSRGWWRSDVGATLVRLALAWIPITLPLMIAIWFYNGEIGPSWLGWMEVSGPAVSALFLGRAAWIWFRLGRTAASSTCPAGHRAPATALFCPACGLPIGGKGAPAA